MNNFNVYPFNESSWPVTGFEEKHRHEYFEIIWLKSGTGIHQIDMIDHSYNDSVLFFLAPGQVHKIIQHKKSQGYVLKFLPDVFKQEKDFTDYLFDTCLLDTERSCPKIAIPKHLNDLFDELFLRFIEEFNNRQPHSDIILSSYLKILTTQIRRIKDSSLSKETYINKPQYDLFREFKIAVERNYKTKHTVQDYAIYLNSQARTLNTASRKYSNKSALEIIQDRIILEAKRRLYHDSKSIKELGYELGFDDPAYFTRFFKKNVGTAPQHFKINRVEISNPAFA
ncbi:MAG TPA: helix-turn-helix domain-containing protein [Ginsengibacter sp.]|nr:helix-turn-helix domain-containing protein [Ginsengibacter sp.]